MKFNQVTTLSDGTQVTLMVDRSLQTFLKRDAPSTRRGDDLLLQFLNSSNVLERLEAGIQYVRSQGLEVPQKMDVELAYLPGNFSTARSHAFTHVGHQSDKIVFDVSENINAALAVHEVTHLATPHLCASASDFLCEGLAVYLVDKYARVATDSVSDATLRQEINGERFYRLFNNNPTDSRKERMSYEYGSRVWSLLEFLYGPEKILEIAEQIESDPSSSIDEVFTELTGYSDRYWIANLYDLEDKNYLPVIITKLKDAEPSVRVNAARSLGNIGPEAKEAVPALITALKDPDSDVRYSAIWALEEIGPEVKVLITALEDPDPDVRLWAVGGLEEIGPEAKEAVPALITALKDPDTDVCYNAAWALGNIGSEAKEAVPALIKALKDQDPSVRSSVAVALGMIGPGANEAVPVLIEMLKDTDWDVRAAVAHALGDIGPEAKEAVPVLITYLKDPDPDVRLWAVGVLGEIGQEAKEAVPVLRRMAGKDPSDNVRSAAAYAVRVLNDRGFQ